MTTDFYHERDCRVCSGSLETILHLGDLHPSNFLQPHEVPLPPTPFDLCACEACQMVQLRHTVDPDLMFRKYWYLSGINESMRRELTDVMVSAAARVPLQPYDLVIDVGANDGTLLKNYAKDIIKIAFEPALNLHETLRPHTNMLVSDYFPRGLSQLDNIDGKVKILTSIACFYDLDEPGLFVEAVKRLLAPDGVWVVQFQDWDQMQKASAFDNICMEHLCYYSLGSFARLIAPFGLRVVDAERRAINGGSYRLYVMHDTHMQLMRVGELAVGEEGCEDWDTFSQFAWRCTEAKKQIQAITQPKRHRGIVDVYGASTKFNTLAQWCGLDSTIIRQAWERSPDKVGLRTVGTNIPIVSETTGRVAPPDGLLVGIWQFRDTVIARERQFLEQGGAMIFPLPEVDIVTEDAVA